MVVLSRNMNSKRIVKSKNCTKKSTKNKIDSLHQIRLYLPASYVMYQMLIYVASRS